MANREGTELSVFLFILQLNWNSLSTVYSVNTIVVYFIRTHKNEVEFEVSKSEFNWVYSLCVVFLNTFLIHYVLILCLFFTSLSLLTLPFTHRTLNPFVCMSVSLSCYPSLEMFATIYVFLSVHEMILRFHDWKCYQKFKTK